METVFGSLKSLRDFQEAVFRGESVIRKRPENRWKGSDAVADQFLEGRGTYGGYMEDVSIFMGEFGIPPNEIPDILPQQLLMLKVSAKAMEDAGLPLREERARMGVIIGMDFDAEATNFHLRWNLYNEVQAWRERFHLDDEQASVWLESLRDACGPPLTSTRTVGALGGIVASRIAREFRFGGPSFIVSDDSASGLKALEIGIRSLQQNETDAMLVGAIDLAGDVRNVITTHIVKPFTEKNEIRPFDPSADGTLPGEGAAAIVLKRLDQAVADGDRIYAVIRGIGNAGSQFSVSGFRFPVSDSRFPVADYQSSVKDAYKLSLKLALDEAEISPESVTYVETHGSGDPSEDRIESEALHEFFSSHDQTSEVFRAIGSVKPNIGHTGAAASLASVVKTSLCLYQEIVPPLRNWKLEIQNSTAGSIQRQASSIQHPASSIQHPASNFHIPVYPQFWFRDRKDGPRRASVASITLYGNCSNVILEGFEYESAGQISEKIEKERKQPSGLEDFGLFVVEGDSQNELTEGLDNLREQISGFEIRNSKFGIAARRWYRGNGLNPEKKYAVSIVAENNSQLKKRIAEAKDAVSCQFSLSRQSVAYSSSPLGGSGEIAFVFPGSGNHYVGMGRGIGVYWPEILRKMDAETPQLKTQLVPECYVPWRASWAPGWETEAYKKIISDPLHVISGQVVYSGIVADLVRSFAIKPSAVIGYSLGESAGLFAMGAWSERGEMLRRMSDTDLFTTELAGPCWSARKAWNLSPDEEVNWRVAVVNRSPEVVRNVIGKWPFVRLLIVNTPDECVIGGQKEQVEAAIRTLGCEAVFLEGIVTVHCDAARPVAEAYKALHISPTTPPEDIRFYSCTLGRSHELTSDSAASSILQQALSGFDFTATINQAYEDGVRIFLEMGPQASCTRMIGRILDTKPHLALSADVRGEDDYLTILKCLGTLIAERVPVDLDKLYQRTEDRGQRTTVNRQPSTVNRQPTTNKITVMIGGVPPSPDLPKLGTENLKFETENLKPGNLGTETGKWEVGTGNFETGTGNSEPETRNPDPASSIQHPASSIQFPASSIQHPASSFQHPASSIQHPASSIQHPASSIQFPLSSLMKNTEATSDAHKMFLEFSNELTQNFAKTFAFQTQLLEAALNMPEVGDQRTEDSGQRTTDNRQRTADHRQRTTDSGPPSTVNRQPSTVNRQPSTVNRQPSTVNRQPSTNLAFDREMCMEFAIGSIGKVLGPEFAVVDTYKARVRLPDEPLMLVDRIISVEGEKGSLSAGRLVTEHDVFPGAWYLDGDRAPVCISVEAGQADLFLCSYLGIDLVVKGERTYRLLDAAISFHRGLPRPGDVIRYEIEIEKFVRQGETYLFFFSFEGFIGDEHLITMRNGCAGFFTEEEVRNSGGIILTQEETMPAKGKKDFTELVPLYSESYDDEAVESLRHGDLAGCFGDLFHGIRLAESLWLPKGRMRLIDRVPLLDPEGGRYGLGIIRAEADIHPDDWFLTCHFMDDMVMPGTLMYECCTHTLRVLLLRMGWVTDKPGVCYEPVIGVESVLKCRGPVTPNTKHVIYEVEISEIGYAPEPYVIADALMYADGHRIVKFKDMSMKMTGVVRDEIESQWSQPSTVNRQLSTVNRQPSTVNRQPLFNRDRILAFCIGKPSEAFGEPYKVFDEERTIARLPGPPYAFMDRVVSVEPEPWVLKADGWIEAEYDMPADEWYFKADRSGSMPFCVLLEIALQPCGWLAAYLGSALRSENDLKFRNLGGNAILHHNIPPEAATLTIRSRMTQVSESGGMIIENFDMQVLQGERMLYEGDTYFGFFSKEALAQQVGIRGAKEEAYHPSDGEIARGRSYIFEDEAPLFPDDPKADPAPALGMPAKALRMIDEIEIYMPDGGPHGLGFIRGIKIVDPAEWFFKAHFYQDPVCPGSLGIESFLQLMKFMAADRWKYLLDTHRFEMVTEKQHQWIYRGQVIQKNRKVEVEAVVTDIHDEPVPTIFADGYLKVDGLFIYQMKDFGLRLVPVGG
ncbi:beta-ketoacyl synthase N-terminal-like domain-containing protein [Desulfobacterales bacterium HSG2]|nr:beta-ketoacyl synthase N-terminal-like domain-containing protein [Desulfobacterales bacterium HSG2]